MSAIHSAGYGTPGYENSQAGSELAGKPKVIFEPEAFSPDHDGYNDEFIIRYEVAKSGYVANISIFDAAGRFVQHLAKNEILGTSGEFVWNGGAPHFLLGVVSIGGSTWWVLPCRAGRIRARTPMRDPR